MYGSRIKRRTKTLVIVAPFNERKKRLVSIRVPKHIMNEVILSHLRLKGYSDTIKSFEREGGVKKDSKYYAENERKWISVMIQRNCIKKAISMINNLCPEVALTVKVGFRQKP
eukprot:TRINITY_DN8704_c0_g4_i2.p1 TRINITY_DN8704_c0_g4~~TRINITY_DN8704_c0_g4_i2.p1  ORF type:complete len:113 (-),score=3.77 TRINITY_DN8704_c0_g4_i2:456-794(-)